MLDTLSCICLADLLVILLLLRKDLQEARVGVIFFEMFSLKDSSMASTVCLEKPLDGSGTESELPTHQFKKLELEH